MLNLQESGMGHSTSYQLITMDTLFSDTSRTIVLMVSHALRILKLYKEA